MFRKSREGNTLIAAHVAAGGPAEGDGGMAHEENLIPENSSSHPSGH